MEIKTQEQLLSQLKYDIQQIEIKLKAIEKAKKEMLSLKGTPAYETRQEAVCSWNNEIKEHKSMIDVFYLKFKNL